jgi:tRNA pseudouridine55 synthase
VDGQRAYDRVRAGEEVELAARRVTIFRIDIRGIDRVDTRVLVHITVECSSGTYIRAIARDLGQALKVGGHLTALRRTHSSGFTLEDAHQWDEPGLEPTPLRIALKAFMPEIEISAELTPKVFNGLNVAWTWPDIAGPVMVIESGTDRLLAIGEQSAGKLTYHSVFNQALAD